jgi:general secretion pathway protein B
MSYILDALRKADAERLRGTVPGLHTQPIQLERDQPRERRPLPGWSGFALAAVAVAAAAVAWRIWSGPTVGPPPAPANVMPAPAAMAPHTAAQTTTPPAAAVAARSAAGPVEAPAGAVPTPSAEPVAGTPVAPATTPAGERSSPTSIKAPTAQRTGTADPRAPSPEQTTAPGAPTARTARRAERSTAPAAANPSAPVVPRDQLPDDVKRQLPPLNIGGSMYSPESSQRMLIVNGEVVREGQAAGAGLVLERVNPRSAVLRFREHRFEISF